MNKCGLTGCNNKIEENQIGMLSPFCSLECELRFINPENRRIENFEIATLRFTCRVEKGIATNHIDIVQDNLPELQGFLPDGEYVWELSLNRKNSKEVVEEKK